MPEAARSRPVRLTEPRPAPPPAAELTLSQGGASTAPMLEVSDLSKHFGGLKAVDNFSLSLNRGELAGLIGPNGAGKTTTLKSLMGYLKPKNGDIVWKGHSIVGMKTFDIARQGIGFSPEESEVFGDLTVAENIEMPTWTIQTKLSSEERIALAYKIFLIVL